LWEIPGARCVDLAWHGSLFNRRSRLSVVNSLSPFGCKTSFGGDWIVARADGASLVRRVMLAAVSTSAVELRLSGLAQPGEKVAEQISKEPLSVFSITLLPAGSPHQVFRAHLSFARLPPIVL